jgi:NHL repeat
MRLARASIVFLVLATAVLGQSQEYVISTIAGGAPPLTPVLGSDTACGPVPGCSGFLGDGGPATSAGLNYPQGLAVDTAGDIFIADSQDHRIRRVTPGEIITTVVGSSPVPGKGGFSGDDGPALDAQLNYPTDVAVDGDGNLYIADSENQRIRKVSPDGIISTIAGNGTPGYSGDHGPATRASLCFPSALAVDSAGNIYVADGGNNAIRILRPVPHRGANRN